MPSYCIQEVRGSYPNLASKAGSTKENVTIKGAHHTKSLFIQGHLKYLTLTDPTKVWMPDTFFRNEKEARRHEIIVPNVYVRIFPNGEILYSIRFEAIMSYRPKPHSK